jgi:hypothetical protein
MEIVVFAEQFKNGNWDVWKHVCSPEEGEAVVDAALARAKVRSSRERPIHNDFLAGARSTFNVVHGPATNPQDGDLRVYCVCVDKIVIGVLEKIRQHCPKFAGTQEFVKVAIEEPLYRLGATATADFV